MAIAAARPYLLAMSHSSLIAGVEDWLIGKALADPDIGALFGKLCERLNATGIPLERGSISWPTLHPLYRAEQVFWRLGEGTELNQYQHANGLSEAWLNSPLHYVHSKGFEHLRRQLVGPGAMLDFDVLVELQEKGFTDYLITATDFGVADVEMFGERKPGILASWATKRESGFSDDDLDALRRIQRVFAVACRASVQRRVMDNLATAYLGPTAGHQVLKGDIRRGDGDMIPAVVWYSDLRGSTRLSDTMDPDTYLALLNQYFECTAGAIIAHGGEILNFIGDGVLAIFPIHATCPLHASACAEKAVHAALAAQAEAEATGTPGGAPLRFGIGLAIGDVMFGNIGVPSRLAFSGIGKVVNAVQRIESNTKILDVPVLASPQFAEAAPGDWASVGEIDIPDFDKRFEAFTLPQYAPSRKGKRRAARTPAE